MIPFIPVWILAFIPYFAGCAFVLTTKPLRGRWLWVEIACILLGAICFRVLFISSPPGLSRDVWLYLWNGRVIAHGYSPYLYAPGNPVLAHLRNIVFANARYRNQTANYPPGAEIFFVLGYLLSPQNLTGIRGLFCLLDIITCVALTWLLFKRGHDPRQAILYAWCPLPIIEFAMEGHSDVIAVMFVMLALASANAEATRTRNRVLTGYFIGMATLARFYPIVLLPAFIQRRDWKLLLTTAITIFLGYLPFLILGHGQVLGFFLSYASEYSGNDGIIHHIVQAIGIHLGLNIHSTALIEYTTDVPIMLVVAFIVIKLRQDGRIGIPMGTLLLLVTIFAISPHIYPWYVSVFLPLIALEVHLLQTAKLLTMRKIVIALIWFYASNMPVDYILSLSVTSRSDWLTYFTITYGPALIYLTMGTGIVSIYLLVVASQIAATP